MTQKFLEKNKNLKGEKKWFTYGGIDLQSI